jgi:hypothetical protein
MGVGALGVLARLAPLSRCITKLLARRTLVEYPNFVAASLGPFDVIFGMQVIHRPTRVFQQSSQKSGHFWCVIRLLRAYFFCRAAPTQRTTIQLTVLADHQLNRWLRT